LVKGCIIHGAYYGNYAFINITITIPIVLVNLQYHDFFSL
jgi:hypothetical protein